MTKLFDDALTAVRQMPADVQDDFARALLDMVEVLQIDDIEPEHRAAVKEGLEQAQRGEFASEADVAEAFQRFVR